VRRKMIELQTPGFDGINRGKRLKRCEARGPVIREIRQENEGKVRNIMDDRQVKRGEKRDPGAMVTLWETVLILSPKKKGVNPSETLRSLRGETEERHGVDVIMEVNSKNGETRVNQDLIPR